MKDNSPVYWKMRNGRLISVDDMDINHLRNTLKMILRASRSYCEHCKYIVDNKKYPHRSMCPNNIINSDAYSYRESQFKLNGDIAQFFNEEQDNSFQNDYYESPLEVGMTDIETGIL